ncbi:mRNA interferase RelE/StbE [Candidatus Methanophagaceae archaeon]|jgi:mRNA interferase RelE/StbE|nr:mRNA interferase RelE/StbE [Methanophagales archaeon]
MSYEVIFSPKSYKQIKSFDEKLKGRIKQAAIEMGNDPWHKGTIKVEGYENVRRKRVGKYRLLYAVDRHRKEVLVVKIEIKGETTYRL